MAETKLAPRLERKVTKLWVPHNGELVPFAFPPKGQDKYVDVGKAILQDGQSLPTGDYIASLTHAAYCFPDVHDEPEFAQVRETVGREWFWFYNLNVWTPKGVYVIPDDNAEGKNETFYLLDRLEIIVERGESIKGVRFSQDGRVRFAPKDTYRLGEHKPGSFARDGYVIASFGEEGAEKIAEITSKLNTQLNVLGCETKTPHQSVSAFGGRPGVGFDLRGDLDDSIFGCSLGLLK